jgi:AraC-like DNA-binding protein
VVTEGFSTLDVAPRERADFWREMVRRHFVPLRIEPLSGRGFDGTVRLRSIGELDAAHVHARPMLASRTRTHIDCSGSDEYFVALHLHGLAQAEQGGRRATLRPGDFTLLDSAQPYRIAFHAAEAFDHLIVRIPREHLEARVANLTRATAFAVRAGSPAGRLAAPALRTLSTSRDATPFVEPVLDLIATAVTQSAGLLAAPASREQQTLNEIKLYTLAHHSDPGLSPARVAHACFLSPRQLHRLFESQHTTFGAFLREARLARVRRDLSDRSLAALTIAEIARRHGYRHAPVLTRTFTLRYGVGPRAFRQASR